MFGLKKIRKSSLSTWWPVKRVRFLLIIYPAEKILSLEQLVAGIAKYFIAFYKVCLFSFGATICRRHSRWYSSLQITFDLLFYSICILIGFFGLICILVRKQCHKISFSTSFFGRYSFPFSTLFGVTFILALDLLNEETNMCMIIKSWFIKRGSSKVAIWHCCFHTFPAGTSSFWSDQLSIFYQL